MIRKPYLISQAIKTYIFASILTMAIGQLNALVDSLLMGHLIGPSGVGKAQLTHLLEATTVLRGILTPRSRS